MRALWCHRALAHIASRAWLVEALAVAAAVLRNQHALVAGTAAVLGLPFIESLLEIVVVLLNGRFGAAG